MKTRLPSTRIAVTHKFNVAGHKGYINVGFFENGKPGEIFITMAKEGSTIGGLMDAVAILTSLGLQNGLELSEICQKLEGQKYQPSGVTTNPEIPIAESLTDYIFKWIRRNCESDTRAVGAAKVPSPEQKSAEDVASGGLTP